MSLLITRVARLALNRSRVFNYGYSTILQARVPSEEQRSIKDPNGNTGQNATSVEKYQISRHIPRKDKADFLAKMVCELKDSKEDVYGALDAWVAWEENFPIGLIRRSLNILEKEQEWHRIVQVIKWMLNKGQGNTMQTYSQMIFALDMDKRADEAHEFWKHKIGINLHSVPWQLCRRMIAIYYRNESFDKLVHLFEELESFDRKPPEKSIVMRVASAYELLGKLEEKDRILEKYSDIIEKVNSPTRSRKPVIKKRKPKK